MAKIQHIHKFKRLRYKSGNEIFFCVLPDCTTKTNIALALGKRSLCWRCGSEFLMNEYSLRLAKPHCSQCHHSKGVNEPIEEIIPFHNQTADTELWDGINLPIPEDKPVEMSLFERLQATIQSAKQAIEKDEDI